MYCQECGKEAQAGEAICSSCGGALTDAELDLPEVAAFPVNPDAQAPVAAAPVFSPETPTMPTAPTMPVAPEVTSASGGPRLEVTVGSLSGSYPLKPEVTTIGRADPATGHRPDVDLSMDQAVSRRHAEIRRSGEGWRIVDVGSTNGTIVNGAQIPRHQEVPLADGDEIRVGENCVLKFRL